MSASRSRLLCYGLGQGGRLGQPRLYTCIGKDVGRPLAVHVFAQQDGIRLEADQPLANADAFGLVYMVTRASWPCRTWDT